MVSGPVVVGGADFLFLHQITALVVGIAVIMDTGDRLLIAAYSLGRHLIQVVILVGTRSFYPSSIGSLLR